MLVQRTRTSRSAIRAPGEVLSRHQGAQIDAAFRVDYLVENRVLVELKAVEKLHPLHSSQLLSYLKISHKTVGLLINFNVVHLRDGIRRVVNGYNPEEG